MGLIKLFKRLRELRHNRKEYHIKPKITFRVDTHDYPFFLLPTILVQPWIYRYPGSYVIDIYWLNFFIGIGKFEPKKKER